MTGRGRVVIGASNFVAAPSHINGMVVRAAVAILGHNRWEVIAVHPNGSTYQALTVRWDGAYIAGEAMKCPDYLAAWDALYLRVQLAIERDGQNQPEPDPAPVSDPVLDLLHDRARGNE